MGTAGRLRASSLRLTLSRYLITIPRRRRRRRRKIIFCRTGRPRTPRRCI